MSREVDLDDLDRDAALYLQQRPNLINEARIQGVHDIDERIADALAGKEAVINTAEEVDPAPTDYEAKDLGELKELAQNRGLNRDGGKKAIVARLVAQDGVGTTVSREAEGAVAIARTGDKEASSLDEADVASTPVAGPGVTQ